jgi:hypothetical protein
MKAKGNERRNPVRLALFRGVGSLPTRPNLLFIVTDSQCGQALPMEADPNLIAPNLVRLAREGVHCSRTYTNYAVCRRPGRSCLRASPRTQPESYTASTEPGDDVSGLEDQRLSNRVHRQVASGWRGVEQFGCSDERRGYARRTALSVAGPDESDWRSFRIAADVVIQTVARRADLRGPLCVPESTSPLMQWQ